MNLKFSELIATIRQEIAAITESLMKNSPVYRNNPKLAEFVKSFIGTAPDSSASDRDSSVKSEPTKATDRKPEATLATVKPTPNIKPHTISEKENFTEEEMKELIKRLEALEARVTRLEKAICTPVAKATGGNLTVVKMIELNPIRAYKFEKDGRLKFSLWHLDEKEVAKTKELINSGDHGMLKTESIWYDDCVLLSDGSLYQYRTVGNTLREVKAFATLIGYPIPDKAKTDILSAAIVNERGADGWCISNGQMLKANGYVYSLKPIKLKELVEECTKESDSFVFGIEPPTFAGKSPEEAFEAFLNFRAAIKPRPLPSKEEIMKQYEEEVRKYKLKHS